MNFFSYWACLNYKTFQKYVNIAIDTTHTNTQQQKCKKNVR